MTNAVTAQRPRAGRWVHANRFRALFVLGAAVFAAGIAAAATVAAGESWTGQAVVTFEQPGVSYTGDQGLENIQFLASAAPTFAERARSDAVVDAVASAIDEPDVDEVRNRIGAVVLPETVAVRLRVQADDEETAELAIAALVDAYAGEIQDLAAEGAPPIDVEVLRSAEAVDQRPSAARSIPLAALVGMVLGAVAVTVVARA